MTKRELEKEATEWVRQKFPMLDLKQSDMSKIYEYEAYLAGAEPREKRIEELEAQIEKMKNCDNCKHDCKLVIAHFGGCDFLGKKEKWEMQEK